MFPKRVVIKSFLLSIGIMAMLVGCTVYCHGQDSGWEIEQRGKSRAILESPPKKPVKTPVKDEVPKPVNLQFKIKEGAEKEIIKKFGVPKLHVGISLVEPMVMDDGEDGYTGFDIELWEMIAGELGVNTEYELMEFRDLFKALKPDSKMDVHIDTALSGITINEEREEYLDFSHAYWNSGLSIAVRKEDDGNWLDSAAAIWDSKQKYVWLLLGFIIIMAHLMWLVDKKDDGHIKSAYFPGIFEAMWFTLVTMTTVGYGDFAPKKWLSRICTAVVMLAGIGLFGIIIAELSSDYTISQLQSDISGPKDLHGRTVATLRGTTSVPVLEKLGAHVIEVAAPETLFDRLMLERADAVVYDTPTVLYYVSKYSNKIMIAGGQFEPQHYGIALPQGSEWRERINKALLKIKEDGRYEQLYRKYFNG